MLLLRPVIFLGTVLCVGAMSAPAQQKSAPKLKPDPKTISETMAWLQEVITKNAGFALPQPARQAETTSAMAGAGPLQEKLTYQFSEGDSCHLNWRAVAAGDEDVLSLYPGLDQNENLAEIVPGSIQAQPVDVQELLAGGVDQPAQIGGDHAQGSLYWKIIASYADNAREEMEPFGFLFKDMTTAQHVAAVLEHGVNLCRGSHIAERETNVGCDASPTLKVINTSSKSKEASMGATGVAFSQNGEMIYFAGHYINQSEKQVSCVAEFTFYTRNGLDKHSKAQARNSLVTFDLDPGQTASASLGMPHNLGESLGAIHYLCYPKGAVNVLHDSCAELSHPLHWDPKKPRETAKP